MNEQFPDRLARIRKLINNLRLSLEKHEEVTAFILYGSYSDNTNHQPTKYSDVDMEIVVNDEKYQQFLDGFRAWFEANLEPVSIATKVGYLQKIFVTNDFVDLQFSITRLRDFDEIDKRQINYFPNGYSILFDKSGALQDKIKASIKPILGKTPQQKLDGLNSSFWYFVQGTVSYIEREEYWFGAAGYWAWLYVILCQVLRMYYQKENAQNNPMKHIEQDLPREIIERIQPLRNLETPMDLKQKMELLIEVYSEYATKLSQEQNLSYDPKIEQAVRNQVSQYLS